MPVFIAPATHQQCRLAVELQLSVCRRRHRILQVSLLLMFMLLQLPVAASDNLPPAITVTTANSTEQQPQSQGHATTSNSTKELAALKAGEYQRVVNNQRPYLLYVPTSLPAGQAVPLVLFFHGGGGNMEHAARSYGWRETAEREAFVVAFPNGYSRFPGGRFASWNAGACCGDARDNQINDMAFVKAMIADIQQQLPINPQRIFASGMSNGGMLAHRLACDMAGTFRAIAAVAGTDNTLSCQPAQPVSVLHIHALDDSHVLFEGGAGKDAFRDKNKITDFISVPDTIKGWQQRLQLPGAPQRVLNLPGAYADLWRRDDGRIQLQLVVTTTGGHSWPGGKAVRGKTPSKAIDANTLIWQFFNSQLP